MASRILAAAIASVCIVSPRASGGREPETAPADVSVDQVRADAITLPGVTDLSITQTAPAVVAPLQNILYVFTVTNAGPSALHSAVVFFKLPLGTALAFGSSCVSSTTTVVCGVGPMAPGDSQSVPALLSTTLTSGSVVNTATVVSSSTDPNPANDTSTAITLVSCAALAMTPSVLPPAFVGARYEQGFGATGGVRPLTFSISGRLPAGLRLINGIALTGTPSERGAFPLTVTMTDSGVCQFSSPYTLVVSRERFFAVGAGTGSLARTFTSAGALRSETAVFDPAFAGGVSVALGDVTGDGPPETIAGAGPGGGPAVRVFDGVTGALIRSFFAFDAGLRAGVEVASGDFNRDGVADIVTVPGFGGPAIVRVFDGRTGALWRQFVVPSAPPTGGLHVAAGDVNGDGVADLVVGGGKFGAPLVQVFDGQTFAAMRSFFAYDPAFTGGVYVAAGDVNGDGFADVVTGAGAGGGPHVKVFDGATGALLPGALGSFFAYTPAFPGGVRVAAGDLNGDGRAEVITGAGPGGGPHVRVFDGATGAERTGLFAFDPSFAGGVFVAGSPGPLARMSLDLPVAGTIGGPAVRVAGWALAETAANTVGVDAIDAWALPVGGGPAVFVGSAVTRPDRPDVAALYGGEFLASGFDFTGVLAPGTYDLYVFARNARTGIFDQWRVVRITL